MEEYRLYWFSKAKIKPGKFAEAAKWWREKAALHDYIHIQDLISAHLLALDALEPGKQLVGVDPVF